MGFTIMSEDIFYTIVYFYAILVASLAYYVDTSERLDGTFQKFVCLQTDDKFDYFVDIYCFMRSDGRDGDNIQ